MKQRLASAQVALDTLRARRGDTVPGFSSGSTCRMDE